MNRSYFVTGTDTDVGKTWITLGLMKAFQASGLAVNGMKPVASGCELREQGFRNSDALAIQAISSEKNSYNLINPYAFQPAIAPHLAAIQASQEICFAPIKQALQKLSTSVDCTLVEGVGGWRVPLGDEGDIATLVEYLGLPVILVVGLKLGCINHALLTVESIINSGASLLGWIGNQIQPEFSCKEENIQTLKSSISAPCLGIVPYQKQQDLMLIANSLNIDAV